VKEADLKNSQSDNHQSDCQK